jgi:hypothetical protein
MNYKLCEIAYNNNKNSLKYIPDGFKYVLEKK